MPIIAIIDQPASNALGAAYRPIIINVEATATSGAPKPPVVYCDIYFNGRYYKTISKTVFAEQLALSTAWKFDIQDACQEYLGKVIGANGGSSIVPASNLLVRVYCKFRSSGIDLNGFIQSEGVEPVQGTLYTQPLPGSGTQSNTFYVCNSTLQHENNQNLGLHLEAYKRGTWAADAFPATHRNDRYRIGINQSDYFPVLISSAACVGKLRLRYKYLGQSTIWSNTAVMTEACTASIVRVDGFGAGSGAITIVWEASGNAINFGYQVDGGTPGVTSNAYLALEALGLGSHTIAITPRCSCGEGETVNFNFTI